MDKNYIQNKLREIIGQVLNKDLTESDVPAGPGFLQELHIDSLMVLQIIVRIEQIFNVVVEDDEVAIKMFDSFNSAVDFIYNSIQNNEIFLNTN